MTLAELANFICTKVNQVDSVSQGCCRDYLNARYQMVYRSDNWRDTMDFNVTAFTVAGSPQIDFPDTLERAVTIQILGTTQTIESVTRQFILESYPQYHNADSTTVTGQPLFFEELHSDGVGGGGRLRLYPAPDKVYPLLIYGKKVFVPLEDDDTPIIRNIENCLIAFVTSDMLDRQRQGAKAKEKLQEAAVLLEAMRKTENELSNVPRRSKNITVSGDSLAEMVDAVSCRVGDYSAPTQIVLREFMRRNYADLWDSELWLESFVLARVNRDGSEIILPEYVDRIISVRANSGLAQLVPADQSLYFGISPQIFEQSGSPVAFSILTPSAVATLPIGTEQLGFVSTSDLDKSPIFVRGETGGVEVSEVVTLNGITPAYSYNLYDMPMTTAKGVTIGDVTVTGRVSGTFLVRLLAAERERKHIRLYLVPIPSDTIDGTECLVLGKRRIHPLVTDEDTPLLRGVANVLIALTERDWLTRIGNDKGAAAAAEKAKASISIMTSREVNQTANAPRIIPAAEAPAGMVTGWGGGWGNGWNGW